MKPLDIAIVVGIFPSVSETFIINQIAFLKQSGHKVTILCTRHIIKDYVPNTILETNRLMDDAVNFTWRGIMPLNKLKRLFTVIKTLYKSVNTTSFSYLIQGFNVFKYKHNTLNGNQFFRLYFKQYFKIHNYDVVHIHFADNAVHLIQQLKQFNNKIVISFHGYDAHKYDTAFYKDLINQKNIHYTVNTNYTKQKVLNLGFMEQNISISPVGLNTSFFKPEVKEHNEFKILFVGRLIELKAPLLAIKIVEQLVKQTKESVKFTIIGDGEEYEKCKAYIKTHNLFQHIHLLGSKSQKEIKTIMNTSDVFLFPGIVDRNGRCENQGLVLQEAQAMKLPVIISDVGGMKEGLIENETGFVIPERDIDGFVEKLELLLHDPKLRHKMGKAGRTFVVNNYDSNILGDKLLKLYTNG